MRENIYFHRGTAAVGDGAREEAPMAAFYLEGLSCCLFMNGEVIKNILFVQHLSSYKVIYDKMKAIKIKSSK